MQEFILTNLPVAQFKTLLTESITEALSEKKNEPKGSDEDRLLKIEEVCSLLHVSKVTIHTWKRKGILPFYRVSNRIFFKKSDVLSALKKSNIQKVTNAGGTK